MSEDISNKGKQRVAFVTGATGFVGSHLARRLVREGWQVHVLSRAGSRLPDTPEFAHVTNHIYDGNTEELVQCVARAKPDVVFHLASLFLSQHETKDISALIQSNVLLGSQLLEAMKANGLTLIINTGTSWQHFNNEHYNPVCLYAATKQAFEAILEFYTQACGIKAITLKLSDTYGPDDSRPKLLSILKAAAISGESLSMSPGDQLINMVHVDDVINAYLIAAKRLLEGVQIRHECYGVSSEKSVSLKQLVAIYEKELGTKLAIQWGKRAYRNREVMVPWVGPTLEGWREEISLEEGIGAIARGAGQEVRW